MISNNDKLNKVNWSEFLEYNEDFFTCLKWKTRRLGNGGKFVDRINESRAGGVNKEGYLVFNYGKSSFSIPKIVWIMHHGAIPVGYSIYFKDNNNLNTTISNLLLEKENTSVSSKYSEEVKRFVKYDETSESGLRWIAKTGKNSNVKIGDVVGSLDKSDGYWKLHGLGFHYKIHRVVWWIHNGEIPKSMYIDHINGVRHDNRIGNLRLVSTELNARNRKMHKNNKTGHNMVTYAEFYNKNGTLIRKYTSSVYLTAWNKTNKSFSCLKYGDDEALRLALAWRDEQLAILQQNNHGYTDRHGT